MTVSLRQSKPVNSFPLTRSSYPRTGITSSFSYYKSKHGAISNKPNRTLLFFSLFFHRNKKHRLKINSAIFGKHPHSVKPNSIDKSQGSSPHRHKIDIARAQRPQNSKNSVRIGKHQAPRSTRLASTTASSPTRLTRVKDQQAHLLVKERTLQHSSLL